MIRIFGVLTKGKGACGPQREIFSRIASGFRDPARDLVIWHPNNSSIGISMCKGVSKGSHIFCNAEGGLILAGHIAEKEPLDAKALFCLYKKNGPRFMDRIRGIFSVVFWDSRLDRIGIINDKLGLFPLYYYEDVTRVVFSTDAESLFAERVVSKELDEGAIAEFFHFGFLVDGKTFVRQVRNLPPGTLVQSTRGSIRQGLYSTRSLFKASRGGTADARQRLQESIRDAVARRQGGGSHTLIHLTGGRDTRLIAACLNAMGRPIKALTDFDEKTPSKEVLLARAIAKKFRIQHSLLQLKETDIGNELDIRRLDVKRLQKGVVKFYSSSSKSNLFRELLGSGCLSGLMGGESLGRMAECYILDGVDRPTEGIFTPGMRKRVKEDAAFSFERTLQDAKKISPGHHKLYLFTHHICRSFFNTIEGEGWSRLTSLFVGHVKYPFLDEDFLKVVFSLSADEVGDLAYRALYEEYFAEFLEIPFLQDLSTQGPIRERQFSSEFCAAIARIAHDHTYQAARFFNDPLEIARKYPAEFFYFLSWHKKYEKNLS